MSTTWRQRLVCLMLCAGLNCGEAQISQVGHPAPVRDVFSDTWVAADALGRSLPAQPEVGGTRPNKFIGLFYFLWLGRHGEQGPFDIAKILQEHPEAINDPKHPNWGPLYAPHHWGESIFGYYVGDDEGVLRKHAQMLGDARVDVIVFDVTNQLTYPESWRALCRVFDEMRRLGNRVPQIAFLCPFGAPRKVVRELYAQLYEKNLYPELWFRWEGKPLILADPAVLGESVVQDQRDEAILNFFTFRKPQPDYFTGPTGSDQWGWLEVYPQHVFYKKPNQPEQMTVGVAQNAVDGKLSVLSNPRAHGRSFHDGRQPEPAGQDTTGRNFSEQWARAMAVDPPFVFITGWNEWIAGRFDNTAPFYKPGPVTFVDQFSQEYSRDTEPMKGGHGDNYYYQLIAGIRRYKGVRPIEPVAARPIQIDGRFDDWAGVTSEYRDTVGDPVARDHRGWGKGSRYVNRTGRNDIVAAKVSYDADNVYFYAKTRVALTSPADPNWMLLFLNCDGNATNGWLGYDFAVRRHTANETETVLERHRQPGYLWDPTVPVQVRARENELELAIPWRALGIEKLPATLDFKWADNIQQTGDWSDFTLNGDAAPNDRYNYRAILR